MKDTFAPGITGTKRLTIDRERTIDFMGEALRVYSTPSMLRDVEHTCRDLILTHLDEGEDTVGVRVEIDHLGPTLAGMWVEVRARVVGIEGRRVEIEAEVCDALDIVGRARHIRFVIDKERQRERLAARRAKAEAAGAL